MTEQQSSFMREAIRMAIENVEKGGGLNKAAFNLTKYVAIFKKL